MLIDQLPVITTIDSADEMPIERGTSTYKITCNNLLKGKLDKDSGVVHETAASNIVSVASDCTITSADYYQYGKVAMLTLTITKGSAVTENVTTVLATLVTNKRPANRACATVPSAANPAKASIFPSGSVATYGTITAGQSLTIVSTYLLA